MPRPLMMPSMCRRYLTCCVSMGITNEATRSFTTGSPAASSTLRCFSVLPTTSVSNIWWTIRSTLEHAGLCRFLRGSLWRDDLGENVWNFSRFSHPYPSVVCFCLFVFLFFLIMNVTGTYLQGFLRKDFAPWMVPPPPSPPLFYFTKRTPNSMSKTVPCPSS